MKKTIFSLVCLFVFAVASRAEEPLTNKNGRVILPQAGDIAIGIDATPFLNYTGNFFGKTSDNDYARNIFNGGQGLYLKYFLTDQSALRLSMNFDFNKIIEKNSVPDQGRLQENPEATAIDVATYNSNRFTLSGGYEMRRGYGRLQGFWGVSAGVAFYSDNIKYEYANAMTSANPTPISTNFSMGGSGAMAERSLEEKVPLSFGARIGGFIGVEYFFAPKISIAGELGLGWQYTWENRGGQDETTYQTYDPALGVVERSRRELNTMTSNGGGFSTQTSGNLALYFHF